MLGVKCAKRLGVWRLDAALDSASLLAAVTTQANARKVTASKLACGKAASSRRIPRRLRRNFLVGIDSYGVLFGS